MACHCGRGCSRDFDTKRYYCDPVQLNLDEGQIFYSILQPSDKPRPWIDNSGVKLMSISLHKSLIDELQKLAEENNMPFEMYVRGVLRSHALEEESISRLGGYNEYE